jgi:hypothetical protein
MVAGQIRSAAMGEVTMFAQWQERGRPRCELGRPAASGTTPAAARRLQPHIAPDGCCGSRRSPIMSTTLDWN